MNEKCDKCSGTRCPSCFHTGKRLFEIGQLVVWENQDHSLEPESLKAKSEKYLGGVYTVIALMDCPGGDFVDLYYVGIDTKSDEKWVTGRDGRLVFDANLRPATSSEIADAGTGESAEND